MNRKGFTLIELIAVIVVISILLLIVVPNVTNILQDKKQTMYDNSVNEIEKVAAQYVSFNPNLITDNTPYNIQLTTLCTEKFISCPIRNPLTEGNFSGYITVDEDENGRYTYNFVSE
jgi:prepilin-type N-terminal cleavage/methylation domain-containing protein